MMQTQGPLESTVARAGKDMLLVAIPAQRSAKLQAGRSTSLGSAGATET